MVVNADDDPVEIKPIFVDNFGDVKPSKVEVKPNIDGASVLVETSLYVDSSVVPLDANEVDTAQFFSKKLNDLLNWLCRQANRAGFTIIIRRSNLINPMLQFVRERSGDHKVPEKKLKHVAIDSRIYGCMSMVRGYLSRKTND